MNNWEACCTRRRKLLSKNNGQPNHFATLSRHFLLGILTLSLVGCSTTNAIVSDAIVAPFTADIPILVYHHIRDTKPYPKSTWSYKMSVSPSIFEAQMQWLNDRGYTTITLDEYVALRNGTKASVNKPVVITFDDNNRSQYELAYPVLAKNGQVATFYMVSNRVKNSAFLTEEEIRTMAKGGMDIQSHSVSHPTMTNLSAANLERELLESKKALEKLLGAPVRHIAYPNTAHNPRVRDATKKAGYVTGTIMDPRYARSTDDWMKLPRIMMTDDTVLATVLP